ncbi:MAG TPA: RDD family protein [Solirubrobacteraceae bacterium]|nr:RDD family protein [Solirubrobacteraceae bacterium]
MSIAQGVTSGTPLLHQNRRQLDSRRVGAVLLDGLLLSPMVLLARQYDFGADVLALALALVYFFLCDITTGQTVGKAVLGLRTVTVDGQIPGPRAAAPRTILRIVDHSLIGLLVMVISGGRRQRLGDLAGRTVVVRADDVRPPARTFRLADAAYPALWLAPALALFVLSAEGKVAGTYRADADAICAEAGAVSHQIQRVDQLLVLFRQQQAALEALDPPMNWEARHDRLVAEASALTTQLVVLVSRATASRRPERTLRRGLTKLDAANRAASARIAALGFEDCGETA